MGARLHGKDPILGIERLANDNEEFTQWSSFTPTGSWITNATYSGNYRVIGDTLEAKTEISLSGAPTSTTLQLNLPPGYTINPDYLPATRETPVGYATLTTTGASYVGVALWDSGFEDQVSIHFLDGAGSTSGFSVEASAVSETTPFTWGSGDNLDIHYSIPVNKIPLLETPVFWLDASEASSFSLTGTTVDSWSDIGTSGVSLSQTGAARPTLVQNVANGLPGVLFDDSSNQWLFATASPITGYPFTVFIVAELVTPESSSGGQLWRFSADANQFLHGVGCYDNGSGTSFYIISDSSINNTIASLDTGFWLNQPGVNSTTEDGTNRNNRTIGQAGTTEVEGGWTPNTLARTQLGFTGSQYWNGYIFEMRVYSRVLSDLEREYEEQILANKWGISP